MIIETAATAIPTIRPKRLGDGMLTPVRPLKFSDPHTGVGELLPGRDQVSVHWWGYKERPELFRVVNRDDEVTAARHSERLERTRRGIERGRTGTTRATTSSRLLASDPQETWRLP
jgi:hypothetical protein